MKGIHYRKWFHLIAKQKKWIISSLAVYAFTVLFLLPIFYHLGNADAQIDIRLQEVHEKLKTDPSNPDLLTDLAWIYFETGKLEDAEAAVDKALEEAENHIGAQYIHGLINTDLFHYDEAEKSFLSIIEETKGEGEGSVLAFYGLGLMYKQKEDYLNALKYLLEASNKKPDFAELHFELGVLYWELGNDILANKSFGRAIMLDNTFSEMAEEIKKK